MQNVQIYNNDCSGNCFSIHPTNTTNKIFNNVLINENRAEYSLFNYLKYAVITNSTISNNDCIGINSLQNSTIENSSIHHNDGGGISGAINCVLSNVDIYNNGSPTFNNEIYGGGISFGGGAATTLNNVNIFQNFATKGGGIYVHSSSELIFSETEKCNIYENYAIIEGTDIWYGI